MTATALYQEAIRKFQGGESLDEGQSERLIAAILDSQLSEVQVAALLAGLAVKGEVASEIAGFARGMRRVAVALDHRQQGLVDTAGTGGDGAGTFNISTTAAFVIAGAGVPVAKHGNRAISGQCGSADVLARLGVRIDAPQEVLKHCLKTCGITFLFAPVFHQAMKVVAPLRRNLAMRTIFNLLGPLLNPAGARRQIIGVFAPHLTEVFAQVLESLGCEHALIFSADDGLDEISIAGPTRVTELKGGAIRTDRLSPQDLGFQSRALDQIKGGGPPENARILRGVLEGECTEGQRDVVLLNAAAGIFVSGRADSLQTAVEVARQSLDQGWALARLEQLVECSNRQVKADPSDGV